jgi:hypothetical protein
MVFLHFLDSREWAASGLAQPARAQRFLFQFSIPANDLLTNEVMANGDGTLVLSLHLTTKVQCPDSGLAALTQRRRCTPTGALPNRCWRGSAAIAPAGRDLKVPSRWGYRVDGAKRSLIRSPSVFLICFGPGPPFGFKYREWCLP